MLFYVYVHRLVSQNQAEAIFRAMRKEFCMRGKPGIASRWIETKNLFGISCDPESMADAGYHQDFARPSGLAEEIQSFSQKIRLCRGKGNGARFPPRLSNLA